MNRSNRNLLIKYLILFAVIYFLVKYLPLPTETLSAKNALSISLIVTLFVFLIDYIHPSKKILKPTKENDCPCEEKKTKEDFTLLGKKLPIENNMVQTVSNISANLVKETPAKPVEKKEQKYTKVEISEDLSGSEDSDEDSYDPSGRDPYTFDIYNQQRQTTPKQIEPIGETPAPKVPVYSTTKTVSRQTPPLMQTKEQPPEPKKKAPTQITYEPEEDESKILEDEMKYSQLPPEMHQPLGKRQKLDYKGKQGYWFVPPEQWYPPTYRPPVCTTNNRCPTQPVYAGKGSDYADLLEFDDSRRVLPPDNINIKYISEKLNAGQ